MYGEFTKYKRCWWLLEAGTCSKWAADTYTLIIRMNNTLHIKH